MNKKIWALLVAVVLLLFGYIKLFYKTFSEKAVAQSADCIVALDVKRIANTIIWNTITTPSRWSKMFKSSTKDMGWKDMVEIPDYLLAFHTHGQPLNVWYAMLEVKSEEGFAQGLQRYHFEKLSANEYISEGLKLYLFKSGNKVLVAYTNLQNTKLAATVAAEIFSKKQYISKEKLAAIVDTKSHVAVAVTAGIFLAKDGIITANFDKQQIEIKTALTPNKQYAFAESNFSYAANSLSTVGFTQPSPSVYALLSDSAKIKMSTALNFDIDSLLLASNKKYNLDIAAIKPRVDSAVMYTYDDDFNKIEKVVVNNVQEPAFNFTITGDSVENVYANWQRDNKLEKNNAGELFIPMPFVKSYVSKNNNQLSIASANYQAIAPDKTINCIFYLNVLLTKIPPDLLRYLPHGLQKSIENIESIQVVAQRNKEQVLVNGVFHKKKNYLPIVGW